MAKVLLVDDDPGLRVLVSYRLRKSGFEVETATNGDEAIDQILKSSPDLVLLDVIMPGTSGLEVLSRLRAAYPTSHLPVIMFTSRSREDDLELGFKLGADDYIEKPFSPRELVTRVNAVLERTKR